MDGKTILLPQDLPATTRLLNPATGRRQSAKHILQRLGCKLPSTQDQRLVLDEHIEARTPEAASNTEMIDLAGFGLLGTERSVVEVLEQIESQRKSRELKLATHEDVEPADPNTTRDKVAQWFGITEAAWFQMCTNPKSIFDAYATRVADELNFKPINFTDIAHIVRVEHFDEDERDLMTTVPSAAASEQLLDKLLDLYNAIPDLPGFDLTKQYFFEYTFFLFKCSRIKGQEALRSDRFLEFLINSYAKSSNEISLTYIEKLLETQVPYLGESSAREILA
ncbi:MAG: hypothetical protein OXU45_09225, partial [Candidatus Melainabacteria bacterium]|nr:hypothetical protein [Candidatus Melainabacteria bacterium]